MDALMRAEGLSKRYGSVQALQDLSLSLEPGAVVGLLGANGAGKSTLIQILVGLVPPSSGRVVLSGVCLGEEPEAARGRLGYAPEHPDFYELLTARETLTYCGGLLELPRLQTQKETDFWLERFDLAEAADRPVAGFSQGMRRKLVLACALLGHPEVVILDEPTNGLDPVSTALLKNIINALRERGTAVLVSSHVLGFVESICDRLVVLASGRLIAAGAPEAVVEELGGARSLEAAFLELTGEQPKGPFLAPS